MGSNQMLDLITSRYEAVCHSVSDISDAVVDSTTAVASRDALIVAFNELSGLFETMLAEASDDKRLIAVPTTALASSQRQVTSLEWQRGLDAVSHIKAKQSDSSVERT